ncbi:Wzz/FepE/Etk N-terminal domain-containing protein [uncultured Dysgonomonas sp.]|uniref:Polysaccharide chain length determinant N-terminal domain-containing protein n=1 Tax=uncultured Dysgonomonas sp. TaxID=206096 RepID=A0A212J8L2_9BACT|nr:Wzz/FepE/Etk N-terminal domain-containing protein [uncultured Dysgonomonas sp.]SBV95770.1 conserved hypothetical protein [uncultured Dysgonomonas sp.]
MEEKKNNIAEEKEIDLLALANKIWVNKKFIIKALGIGLVIALIVAFSIPKEYTTTVILMPEAQSGTSSMNSLAALAGVNIGGTTGIDALASPDLYPSVFESTPFIKGLFDMNVKDLKQGIDTTFYSYMNNYQSYAWWSYLLKAPGLFMNLFFTEDDSIIKDVDNNRIMSKMDMDIIKSLKDRIIISSEKKTAVTTIEVTMQSPEISAYLVDTLTLYFQSYIIDYRTQKARNDLLFAEKLYEEAKTDYYTAQQKLATYSDANLNVVSAKYRITQERLQNEANLAYSVYNQAAQQLQLAKVKVQDNTPVFTIIQPAVQPIEPSKPSKKIILAGFLLISFLSASAWIIKEDILYLIR